MWTKCEQTPYLIDKAILGKMGGAYVTDVDDDGDEGQRCSHWYAPLKVCIIKSLASSHS